MRHSLSKHRLRIEIVDTSTSGRIKTLNVEGNKVRVLSVEDVIVDRLNACKHWMSRRDCEHAEFLLRKYRGSIDKSYLRQQAKLEDVLDVLREIS